MTDEERREAARRLRDFKQLRAAFKDSSICAFLDVLGVGYMDWEHICARLADLIEPEPERTCHIAMVSPGEWEGRMTDDNPADRQPDCPSDPCREGGRDAVRRLAARAVDAVAAAFAAGDPEAAENRVGSLFALAYDCGYNRGCADATPDRLPRHVECPSCGWCGRVSTLARDPSRERALGLDGAPSDSRPAYCPSCGRRLGC